MKNRHQSLVLRWLFLCAAVFLFAGTVSLYAQELDVAQDPNVADLQEVSANRPGGGIHVDANGTIRRDAEKDSGVLRERQIRIAIADYQLHGDVTASSPMRCISLNRLEKAYAEAIEGNSVTKEMLYLAGIQRITHVFYFSESKDIVIAGPAEAWFPGYDNIMMGVTTRQPVLELRHFITALRAYAPGGNDRNIVGCSIDPTEEGIARLQQFEQEFNSARGGSRQAFLQGVRESLGMQTIRIDGIPATTHAAQMMVAADYRMKLLALGIDRIALAPRAGRLQTFIDNTVPNTDNALFRWYFTPNYDSVILTEDRTGMQLVGTGVKLVGENELEGVVVAGLDPGSMAFTQSFTRLYPRIAERAPVFAQLRNWIDMLICAAHIQREDFYGKSGWSMEFFDNEEKFPLETFPAPKEVEPVVGSQIFRRGRAEVLAAPVGGGIVIETELALDEENVKSDTDKKIAERQKTIALNLPEGVWWWDVK